MKNLFTSLLVAAAVLFSGLSSALTIKIDLATDVAVFSMSSTAYGFHQVTITDEYNSTNGLVEEVLVPYSAINYPAIEFPVVCGALKCEQASLVQITYFIEYSSQSSTLDSNFKFSALYTDSNGGNITWSTLFTHVGEPNSFITGTIVVKVEDLVVGLGVLQTDSGLLTLDITGGNTKFNTGSAQIVVEVLESEEWDK